KGGSSRGGPAAERRRLGGNPGTPRSRLRPNRRPRAGAACRAVGRAPVHARSRSHRPRSGPQSKAPPRARSARPHRPRRYPSGFPGSPRRLMARRLVVLFALVVVGAGVAIGYFLLGASTPLFSTRIGQLADPMAPVDPQDSTPVVVTVPPGSTANDIGTD